ncbi:MAG: CBS domain-containing protein [Candidatus Nanoarchaeia archaeon]|nr:CBS domain-containing protein [Candidatus Haiyanarchaeum thermophilum]MCW1302948.1 CBS domain-containing protein [Candidatus Haiyanarchaeum thermophilum]MCW1303626.1 CBS domain-containing protein [Candidatus Haiyanarchaeum thermophilum]MCW1306307.1 CBS domain-containing protein [Candidatus Haiyanarchaeum thermophilum]MCW1307183.1 CBS domain-containing protein [Candidatus Haiyanarchaeum thermophilum]
MLVEDLMKRKVITVTKDEDVMRAVALMEKYDIKELPVVEDSKVIGIVTLYDFLYLGKVSGNVGSYMFSPPLIHRKATLEEALELMVASGVEALPVIDENGKLVGIISEYDILSSFRDAPIFRQLQARDVMRRYFAPIHPDDNIGKALRIMQFYRIDRLPVVDEQNKVEGIVLLIDILRVLSLKRFNKLKFKPEKLISTEVKGVLRKLHFKVREDTPVSQVLTYMLKERLKGTYVTNERDEPVGIILRRDLLEKLRSSRKLEVMFSGVEITQTLMQPITPILRKLHLIFPEWDRIEVHVKRVGRNKYEVRIPIRPYHTTIHHIDFSLRKAVKVGFDKLYEFLRRRRE